MATDSAVLLKGYKDGLKIILNENYDFESIKNELSSKIIQSKKFLKGSKCAIMFQGKKLSDVEEHALLYLLNEKGDMNISFVYSNEAENVASHAETKAPGISLSKMLNDECMAKIHRGSVRSGQEIKYDGSIIVLGDINPGGFLTATESIIVLGALKGQAHAGCTGNQDAFVASIFFAPTQLRIADIITRFPDDISKKVQIKPEYAYIEGGNICITPLM